MQKLLDSQQRQQSPDVVKEIVKEAENIIEKAESFARCVYEAASRYGSASSNGSRYYIRKPKDSSGGCNKNDEYYVLQHHADLEKKVRQEIEDILSKDNWNLVTATSTLELGVDIPGVAVVLQYGAPPSGESFVQRVGRSGRNEWSFRTAFGAVFARNVGKDIMLIDETEAIRSLYNLTRPSYSPEPDTETLARYMALIYFDRAIFDSDRAIIKTIGAKRSIDDPIVQALFQSLLKLYYLNDDKKITETLDIFKKIVENSERYKQILEWMLRSGEINKLRGTIPVALLGDDDGIVDRLMAIETRLSRDVKRRLEAIKSELEEIGLGLKYAKEIEKKVEKIDRLVESVDSLREEIEGALAKRGRRFSISIYLHEYATYIYNRLHDVNTEFGKTVEVDYIDKIVNDINKTINVNKSRALKDLLDKLDKVKNDINKVKNDINKAERMILSTIIASDEICLSSWLHDDTYATSYDDIMALLLGMPMPHPVFYSGPGNGCLFVFNEVEISHGKIKLKSKLKGKIAGNANRVDVLSNVPFKHYEVP